MPAAFCCCMFCCFRRYTTHIITVPHCRWQIPNKSGKYPVEHSRLRRIDNRTRAYKMCYYHHETCAACPVFSGWPFGPRTNEKNTIRVVRACKVRREQKPDAPRRNNATKCLKPKKKIIIIIVIRKACGLCLRRPRANTVRPVRRPKVFSGHTARASVS